MIRRFILITVIGLSGIFELNAQLTPTAKLALVQGKATNFKEVPLKKEAFVFVDVKTKKEFKVNTDDNGKFEILIPVAATYSLKYKNFTSDMDYTQMVVPADPDATYEIGVKIDPPKEFTLNDVLFDTGKSTLKPSSNKQLNDLYEVLKLKSTMVVEVQGHTDNVGKSEDNMKLSEERAKAVCAYLVKKGIETNRLIAKGYGDTRPVADNLNPAGQAKNRRTQLKVIKE